MNVWVILGGMSAEREVALESGRAVAAALRERGHGTWVYELRDGIFLAEEGSLTPPHIAGTPDEAGWAERLLATARDLRGSADVAFLALHGGAGEGGTVQALLSTVPMPYTGSGPEASAIALDKVLSKRVMIGLGIPTPAWTVLHVPPWSGPETLAEAPVGGLPAVVKPVAEGSSVGVSIVHDTSEWKPALERVVAAEQRPRGQATQVLVEKYIPGRELTVGILGGRVLPVLEIVPRTGFYDYERKYAAGESEYRVPAEIDVDLAARLQDEAARLNAALGCRGMARVDYRLSPDGEGYCLELNTIPGLTATSLVPKAAAAVGIGFGELLEELCAGART